MTIARSFRGLCALAAVIAILATASPVAAATADDFAGTWLARDGNDGSLQRLRIAPDLEVSLFDTRASICSAGAPARVTGQGEIVGDTLVVELSIDCLAGPDPAFTVLGSFTLTSPRVLVDDLGEISSTWRRLGP